LYEFRNKAVKYFNLQKGEVIHHLRETEEQRNFNDQYYERWGFDFDGNMKYAIKMSNSNHTIYHNKVGSMGMKNKTFSEQWKKEQSERGKKRFKNPIEREKVSKRFKGIPKTKEHNKKNSEALMGMKLFNNSIINIRAKECPKGFIPGIMKREFSQERFNNYSKSNKGLIWFNNGIKNIRAKECPKGFVKGFLSNIRKIDNFLAIQV